MRRSHAPGGGGVSEGIVMLLPDHKLVCRVYNEGLGCIRKAVRHYAAYHRNVSLTFQCCGCGRASSNSHSISCHVPKCKGRHEDENIGKPFVCGECFLRLDSNGAFLTQAACIPCDLDL